jgi:hypothetical protein
VINIQINTNSYNIDVAKIFGVCSAVFITCIYQEYLYQTRNKKSNDNDTIALSRAEIYERTGLDDEKQIDVELALVACGIISTKPLQNVPNKNYYIFNSEQFDKIMTAKSPDDIINSSQAIQFIKKPRVEPVSKRQTHIAKLKSSVSVDDPILQQYFCDWIDAVYTNPKGFLSPSSVNIAQQELLAYCKNNQDVQIAIMRIAIKGGLRDITWAIQKYEETNTKQINNNFVTYKDIKSDGSNVINEEF